MKTFITAALCLIALQAHADNNIYHNGWIDFNKNGVKDVYEDSRSDIDDRIKDLLGQMTVEEKTCQMATLYGFDRINLRPGESRTVKFTILPEDLEILDRDMHWTVEPGEFEVRIGSSSADIRIKDSFTVI